MRRPLVAGLVVLVVVVLVRWLSRDELGTIPLDRDHRSQPVP